MNIKIKLIHNDKFMKKLLNNILKSRGLVAIGAPYLEGDKWLIPVMKKDILKQIEDYVLSQKKPDLQIQAISDVLDYGNYLHRLHTLTPEEQNDFLNTMETGNMTEEKRMILNNATAEQKDYYLSSWARDNYFKRCAWLQYLYGDTEEKPTDNDSKGN